MFGRNFHLTGLGGILTFCCIENVSQPVHAFFPLGPATLRVQSLPPGQPRAPAGGPWAQPQCSTGLRQQDKPTFHAGSRAREKGKFSSSTAVADSNNPIFRSEGQGKFSSGV